MTTGAIDFCQENNNHLELAAKTVDWLVKNTTINKFEISKNGVSGYQREIKQEHVKKIINYIENHEFYFPSSIVCSRPKDKQGKLFVVDGQHRIAAFRQLQKSNPKRFDEIKNIKIPVTILNNVSIQTETDTFITINKTSRKVDTSLAYILKNQLANNYQDKNSPKIDYLAVELAQRINFDEENNLWYNQISFDGEAGANHYFLSLNSFVKAERRIIRKLMLLKLINIDLTDKKQIEKTLGFLIKVFNCIWRNVQKKWPDLFFSNKVYDSIITGPIGFTTINKFIALKIDRKNETDLEDQIKAVVFGLNIPSSKWLKGSSFSKLSSEAGYSEIVDYLMKHCDA